MKKNQKNEKQFLEYFDKRYDILLNGKKNANKKDYCDLRKSQIYK